MKASPDAEEPKPAERHPVEPPAPSPAAQTKAPVSLAPEDYERLVQSKEQYLRAAAEFENTKKRLQREKDEFAKYAVETVVRELLPIIDGLDQALEAVDKQSDPQAIIKGVHLIYRQLLGLLDKEGIKRIPTVGERFDPHRHEAVGQVEPTDGVKEGMIVEDVQVGYTMHGKVVRPALVKVAKKQGHVTQDPS